MSKKLSVVIPAYNEGKRIRETLEQTDKYLEVQDYDYEIIVVDNGSKDETEEVVKKYQKSTVENLIILHRADVLMGKGYAVKEGILRVASSDFILFMDADNATPVSEVKKFWQYFDQGYDVIIGSRYLDQSQVKAKQPWYRIVLSRISNLLIQVLVAPGIKDTQAGFKAFTKKSAKEIFTKVSVTGWGFDMEVLTIARKLGYKIKEVPITWTEHGGSKLPLSAYLQSLRDLIKIKFKSLTGKYK